MKTKGERSHYTLFLAFHRRLSALVSQRRNVSKVKSSSVAEKNNEIANCLFPRYMKYLYPYECSKKKLSTPAELQAAIDGNRRDSRRSFGSFLSQTVPSDGGRPYSSPSPTTTPPAFTTSSSPGISRRSSPGPGSAASSSNHEVSLFQAFR